MFPYIQNQFYDKTLILTRQRDIYYLSMFQASITGEWNFSLMFDLIIFL